MAASLRIFRFLTISKHYQNKLKLPKLYSSPVTNYVRRISQTYPRYAEQTVSAAEVKKRMETLTDKFAEAREMLDDARESMGTVYFSEDMEEAQGAVNETLDEYKSLLNSLSEKQKQEVISTIGLRMEELKAQKAAIEETLKD